MEIRTATHCDPVLHDLCYAVKNKQALNAWAKLER